MNPLPAPAAASVPGPVALAMIYLAKNFTSGDTFAIYAPATDGPGSVYTVAHMTGTPTGIPTPTVCQVPGSDLAGYAAGAVRIMRHPGTEVIVCTNTAPWPLAATLPH